MPVFDNKITTHHFKRWNHSHRHILSLPASRFTISICCDNPDQSRPAHGKKYNLTNLHDHCQFGFAQICYKYRIHYPFKVNIPEVFNE
nr:hypothetical transcript [Hymenolepis microstoma]